MIDFVDSYTRLTHVEELKIHAPIKQLVGKNIFLFDNHIFYNYI